MREEILAFINEIIKREAPLDPFKNKAEAYDVFHSSDPLEKHLSMRHDLTQMVEDDLLSNSALDSFGYAIFWLEMSDKYNLEEEYTNGIDYDHYSIKELIDVCASNIPRAT